MHCPFCRHPDSRVVDSRTTDDGTSIRRRRQCPDCSRRFTTVETASLMVIKRSGVTEPFSRNKVISGVRKACQGRPVTEDALAQLGCHRVFEDRASGARADRPGLAAALSHLRRGDTLVVWRLDRLGRTTHQLVNLLNEFEREGIRLRSLQDGIDPASVMGKAMLQIGAVFAEMERNLLRERTKAGLAAARARGP